jgi:hypothetical protein
MPLPGRALREVAMKMRFAGFIGLCAVAVTACTPTVATPHTVGGGLAELQARSSFDLGCGQEQLRLYNFDERTKGVSGCGRRLTYVRSCELNNGVSSCTWMLDTPTSAQQAWPAQASPSVDPAAAADPFAGRGAIHVRDPRPSFSPTTGSSNAHELPCRDRSCARFRDPLAIDPPVAPPSSAEPPPLPEDRLDRGF